MRISSLLMTGAVAAVASSAMAQSQSFGTLSFPSSGGGSTEIPYLWSDNSNDNTNFLYTNQTVNGKSLTVGLRASPYYTGDNGLPNYVGNNTFQVQAGTTVPVRCTITTAALRACKLMPAGTETPNELSMVITV